MAKMFPGEHSPEESWGFAAPRLCTEEEIAEMNAKGATVGCTRCGRRYPLEEALRWPRWRVQVDRLPENYVGTIRSSFVRCFECSAAALTQIHGEWQPDGTISGDVIRALSPVSVGEVVELGELVDRLQAAGS